MIFFLFFYLTNINIIGGQKRIYLTFHAQVSSRTSRFFKSQFCILTFKYFIIFSPLSFTLPSHQSFLLIAISELQCYRNDNIVRYVKVSCATHTSRLFLVISVGYLLRDSFIISDIRNLSPCENKSILKNISKLTTLSNLFLLFDMQYPSV